MHLIVTHKASPRVFLYTKLSSLTLTVSLGERTFWLADPYLIEPPENYSIDLSLTLRIHGYSGEADIDDLVSILQRAQDDINEDYYDQFIDERHLEWGFNWNDIVSLLFFPDSRTKWKDLEDALSMAVAFFEAHAETHDGFGFHFVIEKEDVEGNLGHGVANVRI